MGNNQTAKLTNERLKETVTELLTEYKPDLIAKIMYSYKEKCADFVTEFKKHPNNMLANYYIGKIYEKCHPGSRARGRYYLRSAQLGFPIGNYKYGRLCVAQGEHGIRGEDGERFLIKAVESKYKPAIDALVTYYDKIHNYSKMLELLYTSYVEYKDNTYIEKIKQVMGATSKMNSLPDLCVQFYNDYVETNANVTELKKKQEELKTQLEFMPGGTGFKEAKKDFDKNVIEDVCASIDRLQIIDKDIKSLDL